MPSTIEQIEQIEQRTEIGTKEKANPELSRLG